ADHLEVVAALVKFGEATEDDLVTARQSGWPEMAGDIVAVEGDIDVIGGKTAEGVAIHAQPGMLTGSGDGDESRLPTDHVVVCARYCDRQRRTAAIVTAGNG